MTRPPSLRLPDVDALLGLVGRALRAVAAPAAAERTSPAEGIPAAKLEESERRHAAGLMRVNHSGEVAAQALYHGQAAFAGNARTREVLLQAAREEGDHLAWCEQRLRELDARPSLLTPLWYAGSFAIGAAAALAGDRTSLGFVAETERQVERHLDDHLDRLPAADARSRAVLQTMRADEIAHGQHARAAGGAELVPPVKAAMYATSRVMTITSYWF